MMTEPDRPLLPLLQAAEVGDDVQRIFHAATQGNYHDPNILRVLAHQPDVLKHLLRYSKYLLYDGEVEHRLIELVRIKLAQLNACHF